jgi:lipoprotein-anchoring transpeptidase ErfK/SrfK
VKQAGKAIGIGLLAACALAGVAAAFALATVAGAGTATPQQTTEPPPTTTTEPPPTTTEPTPSPRQPGIPSGVTIGSVDVGGLLPYEASALVRKAYSRPLVLVATPIRQFRVRPWNLGAEPYIKKAVGRARWARPGAAIPLDIGVSRARVRTYLERMGRQLRVAPVDARIVLRGAAVRVIPSVEGRRLPLFVNARTIRSALARNSRAPISLVLSAVQPKITEGDLGSAVVIMRDSKRLRYFKGARLVRTFGVATGQSAFPTPTGSYEIVTMQRNPWWYPPPSDWAADADPVPPGPGNPLGTRWMGISAPYVGIHGTPDAASIGYSASHGCVRMRISEAEWLFNHVDVGTPVFIVSR